MAVKLRLKRMGSKKRPFYRIVAADSRSPRDGRFIEVIGTYDAISANGDVKVDKDLAIKWLNNGAIPTDTVRDILSKEGVMKEYHEARMASRKKDTKAPKAAKEPAKKAPAKKAPAKKAATTKKEAK